MKKIVPRQTQKDNEVADAIKPMARINLNIDAEKRYAFKVKATQERTTMTDLLMKWIDEYLEK